MSNRKTDLNCDLGEGEPPARTEALMRHVTSANIACGGHAGDRESMVSCLRLARTTGVRAGAHPGLPSRTDFGRGGSAACDAPGLRAILRAQVGALAELARAEGVALRHVKLHGALYHEVEEDAGLAAAYVEAVADGWPGLVIFGRLGGRVVEAAERLGAEAWPEAFLDRGYRGDGRLVPRGQAGAILGDLPQVVERVRSFRDHGGWRSVDGRWLPIPARTLCVHGDTPGSLELLRAVRAELE